MSGILTLGRMSLTETKTFSHQVNATTGEESVALTGREYTRSGLTDDQVKALQADLMSMLDWDLSVQFSEKTQFNGFYRVKDVGTIYTNWPEAQWFDWSVTLVRIGADTAVDVESRLVSTPKTNVFELAGEKWHAPSIGHYGYTTGTTHPGGSVNRTSSDGTIIVYRGLPANIAPRWGVAATSYLLGRARFLTDGFERSGVRFSALTTNWELSNGLVRVRRPAGDGTIEVSSWGTVSWETKSWVVEVYGLDLTSFDSLTVIRNDIERVTIRLTTHLGATGRILLDLTLRRGSRFVEGYIQTDSSGTLGLSLVTPEAIVDQSASGYVVAGSNDGQGNRFVVGAPVSFTANGDGGLSKTTTVELPFFLGSVVNGGSAVSGDSATDLRDQYIGAMSESTRVIKR